ncbi:unnamed protein product [Didymodactylos carnosus]|uniref:DNA mismatch repair protein n=1 Tax=Didymodactylos carnosus TaxID=1234261 RepID=A0A814TGY5_9BILA|nr:unnamed protein product [Didymodactylos carnosus]CAF1162083.1 unnamed protein product [Didymodactylos carnosus]CAF3787265.1 unnamed protein product [Didymodactylos carnosus]CAF3925655.1 unnamed protein product [Didymodactylos carnosus]
MTDKGKKQQITNWFQKLTPTNDSTRTPGRLPTMSKSPLVATSKSEKSARTNLSDIYSATSPPRKKKQDVLNTSEKNEQTPINKRKTLEVCNSDDEEEIPKKRQRSRMHVIRSDDEEENRENHSKNDLMECDSPSTPSSKTTRKTPSKRKTTTVKTTKDDDDYQLEEDSIEEDGGDDDDDDDEKDMEVDGDSEAENEKKSRKSRPSTVSKSKNVATDKKPKEKGSTTENDGKFKHYQLEWLQDGKRQDANRRLHTDPNYDPKTLYVPESFLNSITPAMRQWWVLKTSYYDTILFFKVGKFYELYNEDAVIGVQQLNLSFMKGETAHCGFPEKAYSKFADMLTSKGYKVARVEQTETPEMMKTRVHETKKSTKYDKTVRREICQITTPGTKTFNTLDNENVYRENQYLLCLVERPIQDNKTFQCEFGICLADTAVGQFYIGQFEDDRYYSRLQTLLAQYPPAQILCEKNKLSEKVRKILLLTRAKMEYLIPNKEMFECAKAVDVLRDGNYFTNEKGDIHWPDVFSEIFNEGDKYGLHVRQSYQMAIRALGGLVWYLQYCLIDKELLSMRNFSIFRPADKNIDLKEANGIQQKNMILDATTLFNLEILCTSRGNKDGSLLQAVDKCSTHFGKRLLSRLLVNPLCQVEDINDRLDAIDDLRIKSDLCAKSRDKLKNIPDLERLFCRIHTLGHRPLNDNHPENRAILYEEITYSKRKIMDFLSSLSGLKTANELIKLYEKSNFQSTLIHSMTNRVLIDDENLHLLSTCFPDIDELLKFYDTAFNHKQAKEEGCITPVANVNAEFDQAISDIKDIQKELDDYLKEQKKTLKCQTVKYVDVSKTRYQLEIPDFACKSLNADYEIQSSRKGFKRYHTSEISDLLSKLVEAENRKDIALKSTMSSLFRHFDKHHRIWNRVLQCVGMLDVLLSLTAYSESSTDMCRPTLLNTDLDCNTQPFINIKDGKHPCLANNLGSFIPNDIVLADKSSDQSWQTKSVVLVTGPNMGGKSTLMKETGVLVILAHLGSYVPASSCSMTVCDRIFTRLGAADRIMAGESTFFVELSEASAIIRHATNHSLVLMDELGRGTATFDGTAIACSIVHDLSNRVKCRTLFSTHYHTLVEDFAEHPNVGLGHMACMVETESNCSTDETPSKETITFLYKFINGPCPKSHGFNAARLANIPEKVVQLAQKKAYEFERWITLKRLLSQFKRSSTTQVDDDILKIIANLKINIL